MLFWKLKIWTLNSITLPNMFCRIFLCPFFDATKNIKTLKTQFCLRNFVLKVSEWSEIEAIYVYNSLEMLFSRNPTEGFIKLVSNGHKGLSTTMLLHYLSKQLFNLLNHPRDQQTHKFCLVKGQKPRFPIFSGTMTTIREIRLAL